MSLSPFIRATVFCAFMATGLLQAQNLTISTAGQTGTSGTNWSITGNTLNVAASGSANIHPDVISNHLNSVGNLTVVLPWQSSVIRQCSIDGTITYTGSATRTLTFLIANDIFITTPNQSITATGAGALNVVLRAANAAGGVSPDNGRISIRQNNTINTNGGHLWIGGGSVDVTWNGLTVGNDGARTWSDDVPGLWIENSTLNTNGGNVYLAGLSWNSSANSGVNYGVHMSNSDISSVSGNIEINGELKGRYQIGNGTRIESTTTTATSITTTTGSITISGKGYDNSPNDNGYRFGAVITGSSSTAKTIISSNSGNIQIEGNAYFAATVNDKEGLGIGGATEIISRSGNITIRGTNSLETSGQYCNSIRFDPRNESNSIRVGFDGTNSYTGNILIEGNSIYQRYLHSSTGSIAVQTTGTLTIQPTGTAFTYMRADNAGTLTYDNDWNFGTTLTGFTFGKNTNTLDLNYNGTLSVAGPIAVYGGNININENLNTVAGGTTGTILLKSSADIILAASKSITTSGASVILWANSDNASSNGSIALRNASSIVTGSNTVAGGHIWIGGGSNGTTWNGLAVGSGYAVPGTSFTPSNGGSSIQSGIYLERNSISSFGGNIKIAGDGAASARGIVSYGNTITINAGSGKIEMDGQVTSAAAGNRGGILLGLHENTIASTVNISSSSTTGDAITLTGVGRGTEDAIGLSGTLNIISSGGGNIVMNGNALGSGRSIVAGNYYHGIMNVFANSGNITLNGNTKAVAVAAAVINGLTSSPSKINIGQGGSISSSSSNVVLTADNIAIAAGGIAVNTSGSVTIEPSSNSFTNPLAFPITDLSIANTITGLTLGKSTNTASITVSSAQSIAGPINIYGGAIALNAGITTTNDTTGNILLNGTTLTGTGNISLAAGRTATINISAASTYEGIISGTGSGLTKSGAGLLTLTKDHTYSGTTTISAGDLQVGTGGSVSQASSGTISNTSGVAVASGCKLILTPNENIIFAAPVSGAGGVEIKGASGSYYNTFLTGTAATIAANSTVLEVLTRITGGLMDGVNVIGGGALNAAAYVKSYNAAANSATLQFQQYDGVYTKSVFAQLTQSGTNVQIKGNTSIYGGAAYRNGNTLGADMSTGSTFMGLATSSGSSGYGISKVYMSGKVNFTGVLTYTGNTTLSNTVTNVTSPNTYSYTSKGTQEITDASSSFPSTSTVVNNGLVILNRSTALTIASNMSGTEEVLQVGAAITFTGTNTYSGNTTIDLNKSLIIGSGSTSGSMTGNIINYGTLSFNRSDSSSYTGIVSGTGTLSKSGSGDLTLTGLNTYTGSSTINAGRLILQRDVPATSSSGYSGAGTLVIQPNSNSFTSTVSYPILGFTVSSSIGGLTIGKTTNTANISVTASTTTAGPMTMYGGNISLAVGVELFTTAAGGNVTLLGKSGFTTAANSGTSRGKIMTTGGGNIEINADADGNTVGELDIDWLTIDGGTGNVSMEAATFNWNTSSGVVYPEFYGTGALTFRGGAGSTHPLNLGWMALFQNKSALTVGNPSNTVVVDINPCSNCNSTAYNYTGNNLTVNGPVSIYGSTVSLGQSINSATGGNITLQANTLTFSSGITVSSSGQLIVTAQTPSNSIGVAGATGSLQITTTHLSTNFTNGFSTVQIGSSSQTGNISTNVFTLQDDMSFLTSGTLTLGGKLAMGSNNVTLGSAISAISGTPTYYFQTNGTGTLSRTVANSASLLFPIGNAYYNPVTIANNTGSSDAFSMKVRDDVLEFGTTGSSITKAHVDVTWDINKTNANANSGVNFTLQWESAQERNSISSFALNHYNSGLSAWEFAAGSSASASGSTTKTMSHTGYTGTFSPFAIGDGVSALPVQLLHFDAILQNKNALLTWSTATENNNSGFEIMKSTDGQKWKSIGFVKGAGTTFETQKYRFVDYAFNTLAYYKLHQIDFNGIATPSSVRMLQSAASETPKVIVYPNPSNGKITVATGDLVAATFELYDATGRMLEKGNLSQTHFDIKGLTKGICFLKVYHSMGVETLKICVE